MHHSRITPGNSSMQSHGWIRARNVTASARSLTARRNRLLGEVSEMVMFLLRRGFQAIWGLWGVATIVFLLMRVLGNPAALMLPEGASPEEVAATSEKLGFNDPLIEQY